MARAGDYPTRLEWLRRAPGAPDGFGQRQDTYPGAGFLWAAVEDVAGGRVTEKESDRQQATATVRVRNRPAVDPGDRLRDGWGDVWTVRTVVRGDNELVCEVER